MHDLIIYASTSGAASPACAHRLDDVLVLAVTAHDEGAGRLDQLQPRPEQHRHVDEPPAERVEQV